MILVGDIGGTNSRFAVFSPLDQTLTHKIRRQNAEFADFYALLDDVLGDSILADVPEFETVHLAVACPVADGMARLTNRPNFAFSETRLARAFAQRFGQVITVRLINDFEALAHSLPFLKPKDCTILLDRPRDPDGPFVVLGPGTGLGAGILIQTAQGQYQALPSEGGHIHIPIRNSFELEVMQRIEDAQGGRFADSELAVSGSGLERVYTAIARIHGSANPVRSAAEITTGASMQTDPIARATVTLVGKWMMRVAADLAMVVKPHGGIYLAGGVLTHLMPLLDQSDLQQEFGANRRMALVLDAVPVLTIQSMDAALLGAAMSET